MDENTTEIDGRKITSMEIETIEFVYNDQTIRMAGTRVVTFEDGEVVRYPLHYTSLVATLAHVPEQFGPMVDPA